MGNHVSTSSRSGCLGHQWLHVEISYFVCIKGKDVKINCNKFWILWSPWAAKLDSTESSFAANFHGNLPVMSGIFAAQGILQIAENGRSWLLQRRL